MEVVRSENDILTQAPLRVKFGETEYDVQILRIKKARQWRDKLLAEVKDITEKMQVNAGTQPAFYSSLAFVFLQFPEKMADLVFSYAPDLPREAIEDEATEEQLSRAFGQIVQVAFPFVTELRMMSQTLGIAANFPQAAKSMRPH